MEDKPFVESKVHFQGPSALPVKAQAISCNKELVNDLAVYSFPGMAPPAQVPGLCHLLAEKLANRSHLLSMHRRCSIGFNYLAGFASDIFENEVSNWNIVDMIGEDPLLEGEKKCSSSEHGVFFSLRPSVLTPHLDLNNHCKYMNAGEPFQALFATPPGQKFILFDSSGDNEKLLYHPHALYKFVTPTAEECTFQVAGMYRGDAAVASAALGDMRTSWASSLTIHNMDDQLQGFTPCDVEADSRSHVSYGNKSCRGVAEVSSSFHEDTRDLEALMSSDEDEMSTGHSPSDLTWNNMLENQSSGSCKRKRSDNYCFEEDFDSCQEVESEFKENHYLSELVPGFINGGIYQYQSSASLRKFDSGSDLLKSNDPGGLHLCSALQGDMNEKLCQDYTSLSGKSGETTPRKRSRMDKIKRTLELLRSVIPGGNSMDTADVLGEAIQYVRMLQHKVSKLEAIKRDGSNDVTK